MKNEADIRVGLREIAAAISERGKFLVATHYNPDGDAIGSLLATVYMLRSLGKEADAYCRDPAPAGQAFLAGADAIRNDGAAPSLYEAAILVDCGDLHRVGPKLEKVVKDAPFLINIDHHASSAPFGDVYWVEPTASSTCEMLYDLGLELSVKLTPEIAAQLYTGVLTDTGSFRFSNTSRRVFDIAARLVDAGADPGRIAEEVYDSASPQRLRLLTKVLSTTAFHADNSLATADLTRKMLEETGALGAADSEGFINLLRSVATVRVAVLFREEKDGGVHVSMRSKGDVDVSVFAQNRGGGGHKRAAAFRAQGDVASVRARITRDILDAMARDGAQRGQGA
ncbi:MAG: bifunctional oligoribonuclease/PAP phosphatase NrnA [Syntrophobacteraceae bacterium]